MDTKKINVQKGSDCIFYWSCIRILGESALVKEINHLTPIYLNAANPCLLYMTTHHDF